jgi:hypothetical protein
MRTLTRSFTHLFLLAGLAGCAATDVPTAPAASRSLLVVPDEFPKPSVIKLALERAAAGLLYTSESDYPFVYFFHQGPVARPLTVATFRAALAIRAATPVEVISLDAFFARHIERVDPYDSVAVSLVPRYVALRETIRTVVRDPVVFRVGTIAIDCYVVGTDRDGNIVGLTTIAIET